MVGIGYFSLFTAKFTLLMLTPKRISPSDFGTAITDDAQCVGHGYFFDDIKFKFL